VGPDLRWRVNFFTQILLCHLQLEPKKSERRHKFPFSWAFTTSAFLTTSPGIKAALPRFLVISAAMIGPSFYRRPVTTTFAPLLAKANAAALLIGRRLRLRKRFGFEIFCS
jgi:hypothetical protein